MRLPLAILAAAACHAGDGPVVPAEIAGQWAYNEELTDQLHGVTCRANGTYTITQTGGSFSGSYVQTGVCQDRDGNTASNPGHGEVAAGQITGNALKFEVPPSCRYEGFAVDGRLSGQGLCELFDGAETFRFSGTWEAVR